MENCKVGQRVKISKSSEYYDMVGEDNPINIGGAVIKIYDGYVGLEILVRWDNKEENSYTSKDLELEGEVIYTLNDLTEGRVAMLNDIKLKNVFKILQTAFPKDKDVESLEEFRESCDEAKIFCKASYENVEGYWTFDDFTKNGDLLPRQSAKVFLKEIHTRAKLLNWVNNLPSKGEGNFIDEMFGDTPYKNEGVSEGVKYGGYCTEPNIISGWLAKNGDPEIHAQVEREVEELYNSAIIDGMFEGISDEEFEETTKQMQAEALMGITPKGEEALMREFNSGATRNNDSDKFDFEGFLSPLALEEFAKYMHTHRLQADGKLRDSDNWQKGIDLDSYMKSMWRHFFDTWKQHRGLETPEDQITNLCAVIFNAQGMLHEILKGK